MRQHEVGWRRDNAIPTGEFMKQALLVALVIASRTLSAQAPADTVPGFEARMAMIPMRDGVKLHTFIYRPAGHSEAAAVPHDSDALRDRRRATPEFPRLPKGTGRGRIHLRLSGHSGTLRIGRAIRDESSRSIPTRASMRVPIPTIRSIGCSRTPPTTAAGWESSVSAIPAGSRPWRASIPIPRSGRSHHRRR